MEKDIMHINTPFLRGIASKAIDKVVKDKANFDMKTKINSLKIEVGDESTIHLDIDISVTKDELIRILEPLGLI